MDRIRAELQKKLESLSQRTVDNQQSLFRRGENAYEQKLISKTLDLLNDLIRLKDAGLIDSLEKLLEDLTIRLEELETRGLWGHMPEEQELVLKMKQEVHSARAPVRFVFDLQDKKTDGDVKNESADKPPNISIVDPPAIQPSLPGPSSSTADEDYAIEEEINEVFFFHTLATAPEDIVPPGKSLRSALTRSELRPPSGNGSSSTSGPSTGGRKNPSLQQKISEIVHRAFWDEALEALSNPIPSVQLPRIRALYGDLHAVLVDLIPVNNPCMVTLSSPLSPTSAPVVSAIRHLKEVAIELRRRCAPVRDATLDDIIHRLDEPGVAEERPKKFIEALRDIINLAELMQDDIAAISLSGLSDADLANEVVRIAKVREKRATIQLWGIDNVRENWERWLHEGNDLQALAPHPLPTSDSTNEVEWIRRLLQTLGTDLPVSCQLPPGMKKGRTTADIVLDPGTSADVATRLSANTLPPVFFFWVAQLIHIQNVIQAIIAAAALRSLIPTSRTQPNSPKTGDGHGLDSEPNFMERIWLLLKLELGKDQEAGGSKIVNFADEVVREWKRIHSLKSPNSVPGSVPTLQASSSLQSLPPSNEERLRSAVDRILKPTDPVFVLLKRRLIDGIVSTLSSITSNTQPTGTPSVPNVMQTGRDKNKSTRSQLSPFARTTGVLLGVNSSVPHREHPAHAQVDTLVIKGFDDPVLKRVVVDLLWEVGSVVEWIRDLWRDTLEGIS